MVEEAGARYAPPAEVVPSSRAALEVTELARDRSLHDPVHRRLMRAYWSEGADIGDAKTLLALVAEAGLDRDEAEAAIADAPYRERVRASTAEANRLGIHAIPAFVLDGHMLVMGAQPHAVFERALEDGRKQAMSPPAR
jgi:predicted DsbA family dithiol-disulfide isomerase